MARLLGDGGLDEEARAALREAIHPLACALAIESRLPQPANAEQALQPPLSLCWKEALGPLREWNADPAAPWKPVAESLGAL